MMSTRDVHPELKRFDRHPDTDALADRLRAVEPGQFVSYEELASAIDATAADLIAVRGRLASARRIILKERDVVFHTVIRSGLRRATDSSLVEEAPRATKRVRRMAKKNTRHLSIARGERLTAEELRKRNVHMMVNSAVVSSTSKASQRKLGEQSGKSKLPTARAILSALSGRSPKEPA